MTQRTSEQRAKPVPTQGASFLKGLLTGIVLGVALSAGVALYVTRMPIPFVAHSSQSSTAPDKPVVEMPDVSRHGLVNPSPVTTGATPLPLNASSEPPEAALPTNTLSLPPASLSTPDSAPAPKMAESIATVTYFVQTGAFGKESEAENQRAHLALIGIDATVLSPEVGDKPFYRVRIGPIVSVDEIRTLVATLKNNGISTNIIKVNSVKPKNATSR